MNSTHEIDGLTPARLRAVLAVSTTGSFSEAALRVGSSQSNVSRSVAAVESIVGAALFDRSTRSVRLTDVGREFVERAAVVDAELDAALRATRPDHRPPPRLTIASLSSVTEVHLATAMTELDGVLRLQCVEGLQAAVEHAVSTGRAAAGLGDLSDVDGDLEIRPLWREEFRVAVPSGHRLARRRRIELGDLSTEPLIGFSRDAELRTTVDRELAIARQLRTPDYVVDRFRTALSLVAAGRGVMVVPSIIGDAVPRGARLVRLDHPDLSRTIGVIRRADSEIPPQLDELISHLVVAVSATDGVEVIGDRQGMA